MNYKKIAIVLLVLMLFTVSSYAADIGVVNTDILNFRSGPGTGYELLGQFVRGEMMQVVEKVDGEWSKVNFNGRIFPFGTAKSPRLKVHFPSVCLCFNAYALYLQSCSCCLKNSETVTAVC